MLCTVKEYINENRLLSPNATVIVGFSGGADSVALLHLLQTLGYNCIAAHCNFHLRGEESTRDEIFAREFCRSRHILFEKIDFDTSGYAGSRKLSIEMAARELRYRWFEEVRLKHNAEAIAVGHHKDDSVETVLLNLIRGTGIKGLLGIQPATGSVVRPLLTVNKTELLSYIEHNHLSYMTDTTNREDVYVRNKIRLRVLPLLEEINPSVSDAILRTTSNLAQVNDVYEAIIEEIKKDAVRIENGLAYIDIKRITGFSSPEALLYEILSGYQFNRTVINDVRSALESQSGKEFYSSSHRLVKDRDFLVVAPLSRSDCERVVITEETEGIEHPVCLRFEQLSNTPGFLLKNSKDTACFDKNKLHFPLLLRKWQEKDSFVPFGMTGKQKVSKYFKDHKYNQFQKEETWLLCSGENIVWIVGERTDNRFRVRPDTREIYTVNLRR